MEFKGLTTSSRVINLTPLIDIVFLLLVFFMLTAHFVKDQSLDIALPEASSSAGLDEQGALEILINDKAEILIDKQLVKQDELDAVIKHSLQGRTNKQVILRGDKNSKLDLTIKVMDAARKSGAESLDIITDQP